MSPSAPALTGHIYGQSTIDGSATVQLGDSYTYNYSTFDAKDAIFRNTLVVTLRGIATHKSLKGSFAKVPASDSFIGSLKAALESKIETLEAYLTRIQEIEQRHVHSPDGRELFESVQADAKVSQYMATAHALLPRLSETAKGRCSNKGHVTCLDEFCDLVERLSKQVAARISLDKAIEGIPVGDEPQIADGERSNTLQVNSTNNESGLASSPLEQHYSDSPTNEQHEYLYATQDFWRQLTSIIDDMTKMQKRCWRKLATTVMLFVLIFVVVFVLCWRLFSFAGAPVEWYIFNIIFSFMGAVTILRIARMHMQYWTRPKRLVLPRV